MIWEAMAVDADRDGLLAVSRSLRVHGFAEEAFNALQRRAPDFGRDAVFLSAYCEAGVLARRGGEVWSSAVLLARLAETPADLEQALGQALMVARQGDVKGLVDELERGESPGERCLRAELLDQLGFEATCGGDTFGQRKPDPITGTGLAGKVNRDIKNAIMVGDGVPDAQLAKVLNIPFVAVGWGYAKRNFLQDCGVTSFAETFDELHTMIHSYC